MDVDFAVTSQLVRPRMPLIRFLIIGPYVCSTLLSDPARDDALALCCHFTSIRL
jgi:hypothetical protein